MPDAIKGENKGPNGGRYNNDADAAKGGVDPWPTQGTDVTSAQMSYMPVSVVARNEADKHQATEKDMRGGN